MKIGLYADPHFSNSSSMIKDLYRGMSGRLKCLIESLDWANREFADNEVDYIFCLGDLVDRSVLNAEELTALSLCDFSNHRCLVGNHCRSNQDGSVNAISAILPVVDSPRLFELNGFNILCLPYNSELVDLSHWDNIKIDVILSHNDIKGYDFGGHISSEGYTLEDILKHCSLFINGHLHNGGWLIKDRILNLGALSGMNFASTGGEWEPCIGILTLEKDIPPKIEIIENPYAFRFKKVEFDTIPKLKGYLDKLPERSGRYILQVKVPRSIADNTRQLLDQCSKVHAARVLTKQEDTIVLDKQIVESLEQRGSIFDKLREFIELKKPDYRSEVINEILKDISIEGEA